VILDVVNKNIAEIGQRADKSSVSFAEEFCVLEERQFTGSLVAQFEPRDYVRETRLLKVEQEKMRACGFKQRVKLDHKRPIVLMLQLFKEAGREPHPLLKLEDPFVH
jgi:hypothetical protein